MSSMSIDEFDKIYMKDKIKEDDIFCGANFNEKTGAFIVSKISTSEVGYDFEILGFTEIEYHIGPNMYVFSCDDLVIGRVHKDLIKTIRIKTV